MARLLMAAFTVMAIGSGAFAQSPVWTFPTNSPYAVMAPVWRKVIGAEIYNNMGPPRQPVGPGMSSTCWSATGSCAWFGPPFGVFWAVDLTAAPWNLPADASWADLRAIGGMTGGPGSLGIVFRSPGDSAVTCSTFNFAAQYLAEVGGGTGGARNNDTVRVPLVNGRFEFCWLKGASDPVGPYYFWNPSIVGWAKGE